MVKCRASAVSLGVTLFSAAFLLVGIFMFHSGLRADYSQYLFRLQHDQLDYVSNFANYRKHIACCFNDIDSMRAKEFYQSAYVI
tara:strand:- start:130 stop:381 length:252 start_codon:yes stop_codon:yes gene_type:complete